MSKWIFVFDVLLLLKTRVRINVHNHFQQPWSIRIRFASFKNDSSALGFGIPSI